MGYCNGKRHFVNVEADIHGCPPDERRRRRPGRRDLHFLGTAQLNDPNLEAYLRRVLESLPDHPINRVNELLHWAFAAELPFLRMAA